jgi:hypothetical protein
MLKFASRVILLSETGQLIRFIHGEEANRLLRDGQALRCEPGKTVRQLILPDHHPQERISIHSDSRKSVYIGTMAGGTELTIETHHETRLVITQACRAYAMKAIRRSLKPLYEAVVLQALSPSRPDVRL